MKKYGRFVVSLFLSILLITTIALAHTHSWIVWKTVKEPTCLEEGLQESSCSAPDCGSHSERVVAKKEHYYVPATCTEPKHCVNGCNQTIGTTLPHTFASATCIAPATCTECGFTQGGLGLHNYTSATCLEPRTCTICGTTSGTTTSHDYTTPTCQTPATCKVCGVTSGTVSAHSFQSGTCLQTVKCLWCSATQQGEHNWVEDDRHVSCSICGGIRYLKIEDGPSVI